MARHCSLCKKRGHNKATCGKERKQYVPKGTRACSLCGLNGHNKKTCDLNEERVEAKEQEEKMKKENSNNVLDFDHLNDLNIDSMHIQNLDEEKSRYYSGKWLVNPIKKRVAGRVILFEKGNDVLWYDFSSVVVISGSDAITRSGYHYFDSIPIGEEWTYNHNLSWESEIKDANE